jgi:hypothetical protein
MFFSGVTTSAVARYANAPARAMLSIDKEL